MKCFHHTDLDGRGAAFWVNLSAGLTDMLLRYENKFIPVSYNDRFPIEIVGKDELIYIVDFSIAPEDMTELLKITPNVHWIDHHKTAIEKYAGYPVEIKGVRNVDYSGCMLTYLYLNHLTGGGRDRFSNTITEEMEEKAPMFTKLIEDHDLWRFEYGDKTRGFQLWMDTFAHDFTDSKGPWHDPAALIEGLDTICGKGEVLLQYKREQDRLSATLSSFEVEFEGVKFLAVNEGGNSSQLEAVFDPGKHQAMMLFKMGKDRKFKVSLFGCPEHDIDLSEIAKKYAGGGYRKACGFYVEDISNVLGRTEG